MVTDMFKAGPMKALLSWWIGCFIILVAVFASGATNADALSRFVGDYPTRPVNQRLHFDRVSEVLPVNLIDARLAGSSPTPGGFMFTIPNDPRILDINDLDRYNGYWVPGPKDLERRIIYRSQFGLQGRLFSAAAGAMNLDRKATVALFEGVAAAALAAMLAIIILLIRRCWGDRPAIAALVFCALSTGFNLFASSLYWVAFLHVAPAAVTSAALLSRDVGRVSWAGAYMLMLILFIAKFLSGFEFLTVTVAAAAVPFFLAFSVERITAGRLVRHSAAVFATGVLALGLAMAFYDRQHLEAFGTSGLAHLSSRTDVWIAQSAKGVVDHARDLAKVALVNFIDYRGFGVPNIVVFAIGGYFLLKSARTLISLDLGSQRARVELAVAAAFAASVSWFILQEQHVVFHARYSAYLMAYPFGMILAAGAVRLLQLRGAAVRPTAGPRAVQA